ncbi:huntingtin-like isoform X2 [Hydractinia symbiolongicarpus]|uniref:huntingtin-like isoform X2 n=1 Tax=Hydractinia symbiolongicarpus TaxID=13093 RepID=UPI00254B58F9|nr:huntingtin-like isoform X2 [Hydractinia symbiolongicarpus]
MADKIVKAFEALRSHYLQESTQALGHQPSSSDVAESPGALSRKKDASLSKRERINFCNVIADFLPMQTVKDINEFPQLLTLAMELLLVCCDDGEGDVRLVAGECINRIMKAFLDSNIGRVQVELYKEIKKNGSPRSLRAALQRFGDTCHLIRAHKCRPYVANLLPCIVKIAKRNDDSVQEVLATMMLKLCPVLGNFMTELDIKILLKTFLPNLKSLSATTRRTAASILNSICQNSRKAVHFYSWLISMLLGMITPLTDDLPSHTILGVLLCFRNIVPHLSDVDNTHHTMKGSFGVKKSPFKLIDSKDRILEKKQFLQIYEVTMFCTKHVDHNVVTAALENLYQVLLCQAKPLLEILLSPSGIAPTITGQLATLTGERKNSSEPTEFGDSGIPPDLQSISSMSVSSDMLSEKVESMETSSISEFALGESGQSLDSALYAAMPEIPALKVSQYEAKSTDEGTAGEPDRVNNNENVGDNGEEEEDDGLQLPRTYTQGSMVNIESEPVSFHRDHLGSTVSDIPDNVSQSSLDELYRFESVSSADICAVIERQFNFDAVTCIGVPILHCVRLMCSFLLNGKPGQLLPDSKTRVSVKSLALHCISAAIRLFPEALFAKVIPDDFIMNDAENVSSQLVRDIILFKDHSDPQIRGAIAGIIGHLISTIVQASNGELDEWNNRIAIIYDTENLSIHKLLQIIVKMFEDESAIAIKLSCFATKNFILPLSESSYNVYAYDLAWSMLALANTSYWLVKVEIMEVFQRINYKLMSFLRQPWILFKELSKLNTKFVKLQYEVVNNVLVKLLGDEDARVRYNAALSCVKIIPNLHCTSTGKVYSHKCCMLDDVQSYLEDETVSFGKKFNLKNKSILETNLSYVIRCVMKQQNCATSKFMNHGCVQCFFMLSEVYPISAFPYAWEVFPSYQLKKSPKNPRDRSTKLQPMRQLNFNLLHSSSYGLLNVTFNLISTSWMTLDLQAHQEGLKLCVHFICGAGLKQLHQKAAEATQEQKSEVDTIIGDCQWSSLEDAELIVYAKKLFVHITRLLHVLTHVIEQTNPLANAAKLQLGFQNKDKTPLPGTVTASSPSSPQGVSSMQSTAPANSPRRFTLGKAMHKKQDTDTYLNTTGENTPTTETKTIGTPSTPSSGEKIEKLGIFQHIPHFMKLYEVAKGAFKNYQASSISTSLDKFVAFVRGILESLSLLLELATFNELGPHAEEFLDYLKATARVEEESTFLAVQQLLKGLFGTNVASQPGVFRLAESTRHLVYTHGDPTFVYETSSEPSGVSFESFGMYDSCFLKSYHEVSDSLTLVPVVDSHSSTHDRSSRALSFIKNFKKNSTSHQRPTAKVSKERVSSIQSYIRLFEPLVIQALKAYTTTSSTQLQCQSIHLLDQLIRLRVNYSLLDSDQVFIGFVLKQFDFIENGQINNPELFVPTVFQFLVLLSYECYQPKFTQAKAIIGMPCIISKCDEVMACGQPAATHAIPALKPIVQDLFATQSQVRADTSKDLDTQREVVVSMLLRVINFPEVLVMLTQVLNGSKSDSEKWKRLSRQIIDILLPSLSKLEINLCSMESLNSLHRLFDAVAPLSLRPADIILKALFNIHIPISDVEVVLALSMVVSLLRTLIMQNSEDIIFSRIQQLDNAYIRLSFSLAPKEVDFALLTKKTEQTAAHYLSSFLVFMLRVSVEELVQSRQKLNSDKKIISVLKNLIETYFMLLSYVAKSGAFKKLSSNILSMLFTPMESTTQKDLSLLRSVTRKLLLLKYTDSVCFMKWLFMLQTMGVSDADFWKEFYLPEQTSQEEKHKWVDDFVSNGSLLLYCDIVVTKLKEQKNVDASLVNSLFKNNIESIIANINEIPVKELVSCILQNNDLTGLFIQSLSNLLSTNSFKYKPSILKPLLHQLECVDLAQSSSVVQLLFSFITHIKTYGLARRAETLACRRMEYLQSLPEPEKDLPMDGIVSFSQKKLYINRYPRLCSLIQRLLKNNEAIPQLISHPLDSTDVDLSKYKVDKGWMYTFVKSLCHSCNHSGSQSRSSVRLLRSLNLQDIQKIMEDEKFDIHLLETCILEAKSSEKYTWSKGRAVTTIHNIGMELLSLYDTGGSSESENKDQLLKITKTLVVKHISNIVEPLKDEIVFKSQTYTYYNEQKLSALFQNDKKIEKYFTLLKCVVRFLRLSCCYNQTWNLDMFNGYNIVFFVLVLPQLCTRNLQNKEDSLIHLEICFESLSLLLHCQELSICLNAQPYSYLLMKTIDYVYAIVNQISIRCGDVLVKVEKLCLGYDEDRKSNKPIYEKDKSSFKRSCEQVAEMINALRTVLSLNSTTHANLPTFLVSPLRKVVTGMARIPFVNSYARIPPIVWKFGWEPTLEGLLYTELPPLPVDILKEKEVLQEFVFRVNHIGWTSRMQFEETWAALLGVLSSPPMLEDSSVEVEVEAAQASCLAVHCITSLLLDTTLAPVPGNSSFSQYSVIHRMRDYPFLGSKAGKKLSAIRSQIETVYQQPSTCVDNMKLRPNLCPVVPSLLSTRQRKQQLLYGCMMEEKLFVTNLELPCDFKQFNFGQISASAIRTRLVTSDVQEDTDSDDSDSLIIKVKEKSPVSGQPSDSYRKLDELDIRSCLQFLLELFEQWLSPFAVPKTPLMLKMEATKSLCVLSDLLLELNHYEWMLGILLEFTQTHPVEDDVLMEYLVPTMCKASAVLKLEGNYAERICKQVEVSLKSPHVPLQISCLVGALYILESYISSTNILLTPILTEYITKKLTTLSDSSNYASQRFAVMLWSVSFFLVENCSSEIQDPHFATLVLETAILELCRATQSYAPCAYDVMFRGLERLAVSFSLTRPECDRLAKIASDCISSGSTKRIASALGLLCTCMYTGKDAEQASGLSTIDLVIDAPITDSRLVVMERINSLLTRIRKGELSDAVLLATILPRILLDFLPVQEVMNKLISEFLSSQQPRPELIAKIFNKVSDLLYKEGEESLVRDWVFLCIGSFVQRTPQSMAIWSLSCFFISASTNPWLKSLFPFIVERKGKLEEQDREIFCISALDFYSNQVNFFHRIWKPFKNNNSCKHFVREQTIPRRRMKS